MLAFSDIIDFLLRLLSDDAARAEFEQDPQGTLERAGLEGVTVQDIRDARLQLADSGAVSAVDDGGGSSYGGDDPVREIGYTTNHYAADDDVRFDDSGHADLGLVEHTSTVVTIDDRDTLFFQSIDNSVTVTDSFNEDNSQVTAIQANGSFNSDDDVDIDAENSFNTDDDVVAIQDNDVNGGDESIVVDTDEPAAEAPDLAAVSGPAAPEADEEPGLGEATDEPAEDVTDDATDADAVAV